eukprot:5121388-Amphidinium_carterae.3
MESNKRVISPSFSSLFLQKSCPWSASEPKILVLFESPGGQRSYCTGLGSLPWNFFTVSCALLRYHVRLVRMGSEPPLAPQRAVSACAWQHDHALERGVVPEIVSKQW